MRFSVRKTTKSKHFHRAAGGIDRMVGDRVTLERLAQLALSESGFQMVKWDIRESPNFVAKAEEIMDFYGWNL